MLTNLTNISSLSGLSVPRETEDRLRAYHALLLKWQDKINLISPSTVSTAWDRHFIDSLQLVPLIPEGAKALYDLGSGAGFPGLVLAITRPDLAVTLIESDAKKCAFLAAVSRETGVQVTIANERIEAATARLPAPDLITARALKSLHELLDWVWPWARLKPDLQAIFPKGAQFSDEIAAASTAGWTFDCAEFPSHTDPGARILRLSDISKSRP